MFEIQQRETRHLAEKRTEEEEESRMIRCFLGSGIAVITWRHCLPSILMGEYLLGSESFVQVAETGQQTPLNSIHSRSEWRETDKVNVPLLWKRFQRSGTIKIESLLLSFFFFPPPPIARWKSIRMEARACFAMACFTSCLSNSNNIFFNNSLDRCKIFRGDDG